MDHNPTSGLGVYSSSFAGLLPGRALSPYTLEYLIQESHAAQPASSEPNLPAGLVAAFLGSGGRLISGASTWLRRLALPAAEAHLAVEEWLADVVRGRRTAHLGEVSTLAAFDHSVDPVMALADAAVQRKLTVVEDGAASHLRGWVEVRDPALAQRVAGGWLVVELVPSIGSPMWLHPVALVPGKTRTAVDMPIAGPLLGGTVAVTTAVCLRFAPAPDDDIVKETLLPMAEGVARGLRIWCAACGMEPNDLAQQLLFEMIMPKKMLKWAQWVSRPDSYLFTILRNRARKLLKAAARDRLQQHDEGILPIQDRVQHGQLQHLIDEEAAALLAEALKKITDISRVAFELCTVEGRTHKAVADELNVTENTIALRVSRARKRLRELLGDQSERCGVK